MKIGCSACLQQYEIKFQLISQLATKSVLHMPCVCVCVTEDQLPHGFPSIDMGPQLKVVERSRTATMLCAASGTPDPEITWFKDFLPIDTHTHGRIKQLRSGTGWI